MGGRNFECGAPRKCFPQTFMKPYRDGINYSEEDEASAEVLVKLARRIRRGDCGKGIRSCEIYLSEDFISLGSSTSICWFCLIR